MNNKQLLDIAEVLAALAESIRESCGQEQKEQIPEKPTVTLEQVRGVLAEKSQQGFTADVKALIRKYGAERLSEINPAQFPDMLKEAQVIGNA